MLYVLTKVERYRGI